MNYQTWLNQENRSHTMYLGIRNLTYIIRTQGNGGEVEFREAAPEINKVDTEDLSYKHQTRWFSPFYQEDAHIPKTL